MYEDEIMMVGGDCPTKAIYDLVKSLESLISVKRDNSEISVNPVIIEEHINKVSDLLRKELSLQHEMHDNFYREYRKNNPKMEGTVVSIKPK